LRAVICVIAAAYVGIATTARADGLARASTPRVLVIAAQAKSGSPEAEVIDAVRAALAALSEVQLLPPSPLDLEAVQLAIDCTDESAQCLGEVATRMEAEIVIVPSLKRRADALELQLKRFERGAAQDVATAMRKQAGTRLDATLLDTVPSMLREVLSLSAEDEEPAPKRSRKKKPVAEEVSVEEAIASVEESDEVPPAVEEKNEIVLPVTPLEGIDVAPKARKPRATEVEEGRPALEALMRCFTHPLRIFAVGKVAEQALGRWEGLPCAGYIRHPAQGGESRFRAQFREQVVAHLQP
jgi:hypothetical protein